MAKVDVKLLTSLTNKRKGDIVSIEKGLATKLIAKKIATLVITKED